MFKNLKKLFVIAKYFNSQTFVQTILTIFNFFQKWKFETILKLEYFKKVEYNSYFFKPIYG